jgi:hypothetical protein
LCQSLHLHLHLHQSLLRNLRQSLHLKEKHNVSRY